MHLEIGGLLAKYLIRPSGLLAHGSGGWETRLRMPVTRLLWESSKCWPLASQGLTGRMLQHLQGRAVRAFLC